MAKKDRAKAKTTGSGGEEKKSAVKEVDTGAESFTPGQVDECRPEKTVEVGEPSGEVTEETAEAGAALAQGEGEEELCEEEKLKKRIEELEDKLLRVAAEFDNYKKRMARQFEELIRSANDKILVDLLEVVDNFERALKHSGDNTENTDVDALRKGMELILNQMNDLLRKYDITPIEAVGQPFDPSLHDALMQVESDEYPEGIVAVEMSKGYRQGDRVLRHSKVGVSKGKPEEEV